MSLTAKLALQQLSIARKRTMWTILGIGISIAMITAVNGFASSAMAMFSARGRVMHISERTGVLLIATVLGGIIAMASIIVISNAFRVSANERLRQFGLLKSVGATKKQIAASVMYEAVFLSVVGLPIGLVMGLFTQFIATTLANRMLEPINLLFIESVDQVHFPFVISGVAMALAAVGAFAVIMISAWLPARKAAKVPAVAAIVQSEGFKMKKSPKFSFARLLFGFEGRLAAGQLRRSSRSFRASVVSITISIVLLLASASAHVNLMRQAEMMYSNVNANVRMSFHTQLTGVRWDADTGTWENIINYDEYGNLPSICPSAIQQLTEGLRTVPGTVVRGYGYTNYRVDQPMGDSNRIRLVTVEPELYATLASMAGVAQGSNILINAQRADDIWGVTRETHPFSYMVGTYLTIHRAESWSMFFGSTDVETEICNTRRDIYIHGQVTSVPDVMLYQSFFVPTIVVPEVKLGGYQFFILAEDPGGFLADFRLSDDRDLINVGSRMGASSGVNEMEVLAGIARVFIYGFVGMLMLISATSVISTISTNTRLRLREFAILASVGMTRGGIGKMLALESLLCSMRALLFGLPLGLLAAYGVYHGTQMDRVRFSFILPWQAMLLSIAGVFALTFVTTMFSASRLRGENIIEAIR